MTRLWKRPIRLILVSYLVLGFAYSVITPPLEASDELWHYPMVRYMAQHGLALPVQMPGVETTWRQEGSQPPLYYMMAAILTAGIDTSDFEAVRKINPHADIGLIVPDGNVNMTIHDPSARAFPWRGTMLAIQLSRLLSVLFGGLTVYMTFRLTQILFPSESQHNPIALLAACFTAFNPMFLFISGSVNNDNLSTALASTLLVLIGGLFQRTQKPALRELILIGVLAGAGMLAKFNIGFLLPLIALALGVIAWRHRDLRFFIQSAVITGGLTILISGWWYVRNLQLYGDPTGLNVFIQIVGPRPIPANAAQLWSERQTFLMSYWGFFGGVNVPLPDFMYLVFNAILLVAVVGLLIALSQWRLNRALKDPALLTGRLISLIWIGVLFGGLIRWTSETWASQGRLMFSAIAPLSLWMAVGLRSLPLKTLRPGLIGAWWFGVAALLSLLVITRAYTSSPTLTKTGTASTSPVLFYEPGAEVPALGSAPIPADAYLRVGEYYQFCIPFELNAESRFNRDWSLFVHLETESGVIIAQRDIYLGQGAWATSLIRQQVKRDSFGWCNPVAVKIPDQAFVAPDNRENWLRVYYGFYDLKTGERMPITVEGTPTERAFAGRVGLLSREAGALYPNPTLINYGGEAVLVGYTIQPSTLIAKPDETIQITLYWQRERSLTTDYRVFVQIVEPYSTRVFAQSDAMPANWTRPTSSWAEGEVIEDTHTLKIFSDAAPGTWQIVVGLYELIEGPEGSQYRRVRILTPDGGQAEDYASLSRFKIVP
ncbi:hypothetical protein ARNL5_01371 [Anaerolineae bacterium]|nr:hypothetical protein ARNL5_01371 [Anaerolineae bacterium]